MDHHSQAQSSQPQADVPLAALFRHNLWANLRLLDACVDLDERQLAATTTGTYGTVYDTLKHIVGAELGYLARLSGQKSPFNWDDNLDVPALRAYARRSGEGLIEVAARTTPSDVVPLEWDEKHWPVPASLILTQAINHANEHRAQVMTILTQQGIEPPDLSSWAYIEEHIIPESLKSSGE